MTTENKSIIVNGVEVKHPVERYMQHNITEVVVARRLGAVNGGTLVHQGDYHHDKGYYSENWRWTTHPKDWTDVTKEWRAKEQQPYMQECQQKTPAQKREPALSVVDKVALKLLPTIYHFADLDTKKGYDLWPTVLVKDAFHLAEAFMEVKHARDNKPVDTE